MLMNTKAPLAKLPVTLRDVEAAAATLAGFVKRTKFDHSRTLSDITGAEIWLKFENLQFTATFKERGALNALLALDPGRRARGVVTMSAGNHGQAVAYHGTRLGVHTTVVMPEATPYLKVRRTRDFGAEVVLFGATFDDAAAHAHGLAAERGATVVHPYDDPHVIAGQATATLELLEDAGDLDVLRVPVGGGGLIAGAVLAVAVAGSSAEVVGVQSAFYPSIAAALDGATVAPGGPTIAEGIAVKRIGRLNERLIRERVADVVLVAEPAIETAIAYLLEEEKLVVEGAGAAGQPGLALADPVGRMTALGQPCRQVGCAEGGEHVATIPTACGAHCGGRPAAWCRWSCWQTAPSRTRPTGLRARTDCRVRWGWPSTTCPVYTSDAAEELHGV